MYLETEPEKRKKKNHEKKCQEADSRKKRDLLCTSRLGTDKLIYLRWYDTRPCPAQSP